ncbi:MAG TPA: hypothetical protein VHY37_11420 [Tepidisphaeraceae bacterium]|nr:hypothetical protein [Tepidisphaeraceae bacterium]
MLSTVFLSCAVIGGTLVVAQLLLSVVALGMGHGLHLHHHAGGPAPGFRGAMRGGHRFRLHIPRAVRAGANGAGKPAAATPRAAGRGGRAAGKAAGAGGGAAAFGGHALVVWVQSIFNLQGVVAGATVFGLAGLAASSAKLSPAADLSIAIASALVMMALVERFFDLLTSMDTDGTVEIGQAVGRPATVYLGIPPNNQGQGKITMSLQERSMEFSAVTFQDTPLAAGQKVVVVNVLDPSVMVVVPES